MNDYVIFTDSGCDIAPELLTAWGVRSLPLTFRFDGEAEEHSAYEMDILSFYNKMREGGVAKTSAVSTGAFSEAFEQELKQGKDVLYIGFSSGLSTTFNSGRLAMQGLRERYPERKLLCVDTLAASAGEGLLLSFLVDKKAAGESIEALAEYAEQTKGKVSHWFTVDDLVYLKRGGRIRPTLAFVGNMLGIKPVLHVDDAGHLVSVSKVRGRRGALMAMATKYAETALDPKGGRVYISHGDCLGDAELLAGMLKEKCGATVELICDVGSVIGAHSGPGTLALFFLAKER